MNDSNDSNESNALSALAALAQQTRLQLFRRLVTAGDSGLTPSALIEEFALAPATLSFHLKELRQAGLINQQQQGRSILYSANYAAMNQLIDYLTENCCEGNACELVAHNACSTC